MVTALIVWAVAGALAFVFVIWPALRLAAREDERMRKLMTEDLTNAQ